MCAAELHLASFNAHRFRAAKNDRTAREHEARILIENTGQFGISGVTDESRIVHPASMAAAYYFIDLFFNKLPEEARMQCVHPDNRDRGYSWPGRENYGKEKERWKHFVRYNTAQRPYPENLWPSNEVLFEQLQGMNKHLRGMNAADMVWFQKKGIADVHAQLVALGTACLDALAEFYFGLGPNYFSGTRTVESREYKLVHNNTLQLIQYLNGAEPELQQYFDGQQAAVGDHIFDEHVDSSAGTIGDARHDSEHCLEVKVDDEWRPVVIEGGTYFFQFGKMYRKLVETLIAEGKIDAARLEYGTMTETYHRGIRRSLESRRPGMVEFIHPEADMPLLNGMVASDVLKGDLDSFMAPPTV